MNIGSMDRRIKLQRATINRDANSSAVTTWADLASVWANKADQGGREFRAAGALLSETTTVFRIRYFSGLTSADRVEYGGIKYDILSIGEIGRRDGMTLQCATEATQ